MAAISTSTFPPSGGLIDPTKQAEYPIILGDRLAGKQSPQQSSLINIRYNYKTNKSATPQQRSVITRSSKAQDVYNLTITDKPQSSEQNTLTYTYEGSVDPAQRVSESEERSLVLVFDPNRKAFILESVATQLNFNLRSAPGKTDKQVIEQYAQLKTLLEDDQPSGDDQVQGSTSGDEEPADESNPYDYRHFLPKAKADDAKSTSNHSTPEPQLSTSKANTPVLPATTKPAPGPAARSKPQTNPLRQKKRAAKPANVTDLPTSRPSPKPSIRVDPEDLEKPESPPSDAEKDAPSHNAAPSPGSNIIIDGDLIIDMGSPPPSRPAFKVNPAHFSSNNTPANAIEDDADDDEEMEDLRLPSPAGRAAVTSQPANSEAAPSYEDEVEDDDALAAEMEAAFEESAREEEEARSQQYQQQHRQYNVPSEDESEVSEEE